MPWEEVSACYTSNTDACHRCDVEGQKAWPLWRHTMWPHSTDFKSRWTNLWCWESGLWFPLGVWLSIDWKNEWRSLLGTKNVSSLNPGKSYKDVYIFLKLFSCQGEQSFATPKCALFLDIILSWWFFPGNKRLNRAFHLPLTCRKKFSQKNLLQEGDHLSIMQTKRGRQEGT